MAPAMRVLAAHIFSRHIENDEVTLGNERDLFRELADGQTASKIREHRQSMDGDAANGCLPDVRVICRDHLRRRRRSTFRVDVANDARRVAGYDGSGWHIMRDD